MKYNFIGHELNVDLWESKEVLRVSFYTDFYNFIKNNNGEEDLNKHNIKNAEDFVFLILATIKSTSRVSFYKAKRDEDEIDINVDVNEDYNVPNFLYVKKGE